MSTNEPEHIEERGQCVEIEARSLTIVDEARPDLAIELPTLLVAEDRGPGGAPLRELEPSARLQDVEAAVRGRRERSKKGLFERNYLLGGSPAVGMMRGHLGDGSEALLARVLGGERFSPLASRARGPGRRGRERPALSGAAGAQCGSDVAQTRERSCVTKLMVNGRGSSPSLGECVGLMERIGSTNRR